MPIDVDANPFSPIPGAVGSDYGDPSLSSHDIAAAAAAAAVRGPSATQPGSTFTPMIPAAAAEPAVVPVVEPLASDGEYMQPGTTSAPHPALEGAEPVVIDPAVEPVLPPVAEPGTSITFTPEDYLQMQEAGVNFPVAPDEVPTEFQGIYAELAQSAMDNHHRQQQSVIDAQEAILRVKDFTDRLGTPEGQERMLLSMAMNNPDIFNSAVEKYTRMGEDPTYGESIRRGLEADVKMEAASRKEAAFAHAQMAQKGQQVESRTMRLASRLGVDVEVAKQLVAHRIMQNESNYGKRDITFEEVDQIVTGLKTRSGFKAPTPVVTPGTVAQAAQTPQTPGQAAGTTPAAPEVAKAPLYTTDPGAQQEHVIDRLRSAVTSSSARIRSQGV